MLNEYDATYDDLKIIAINLTINDDEATVLKFVEDNAYSYSMIMDRSNTISAPYKIQYIPFIVLIDEMGVIKYKGSAPGSISDLRLLIDNSL